MRNKKMFIGIVLLIVILLVGIGYAEITGTTLKISGKATASPNADNFVVKFTDTTSTGGKGTTTATKTDDTTASITVTGLTAKGDIATATYTVSNESADLSADLSAEVAKNTNSQYFKVTPEFAKTNIAKGTTTTVTVTVELIKTPIDADVSSDIEVTLTASPVQPAA